MAVRSHGTMLKIGDGTTPTEAFTTVAEVLDITAPALTADKIETTSHDSTREEFVIGVLRNGDATFDINYNPAGATHKSLIADHKAKTLRNFKLVFPDTSEWAFAAYVTNFQPGAPVNGKLTASVTLSPSGDITTPA